MGLQTYRRKRNFTRTAEPRGVLARQNRQRFVVHEHHASRLHYDFRLEAGGVLKSWAIPKGPSLDPRQKRLAVRVEDHPVEYLHFVGHIAEGNYGAGEVLIWDSGHYELVTPGNLVEQIEAGKCSIILHGKKLRGEFHLVRMEGKDKQWLLMKGKDAFAAADKNSGVAGDVVQDRPTARRRGRTTRPALNPRRAAHSTNTAENQEASQSFATRRRTKEQAASAPPAQSVSPVAGAERVPMPDRVTPMLATLVDQPFSRPEWLFETKWDGVRALCFLSYGQMRLVSRNEKDLGFRYPELADLPSVVTAETAILDGEIVAFDTQRRPRFQLLQARVGLKNAQNIARLADEQPVTYCVFDLLYYNGWDVRPAALVERKALLKELLRTTPVVRYSEYVVGEGERYFAQAQAAHLEGIIAKRQRGAYIGRRSHDWLKIKTVLRQEVVIGGYTAPRGTRPYFGALTVGLYDTDGLHYVGHVGGGFTHETLKQVYDLMQPRRTARSLFVDTPRTNEPVQWLRPELVCEVKFGEWTADRRLRQPIFLGLRDDKDPTACTFEPVQEVRRAVQAAEQPTDHRQAKPRVTTVRSLIRVLQAKEAAGEVTVTLGDATLSLTHLDKVYWPEQGYTKGDLLRYYCEVAPAVLAYLKGRPLILMRYPNGITGPSFYQHDVDRVPAFVRTFPAKAESGKTVDYVVCDDLATLLYLVNLGTIAQNPWHSRIASPETPDWVVFDLDPDEVNFTAVQELAVHLKVLLERFGLASYPKTSGASGMHVYVPIEPVYTYAQVAHFAELVARLATREHPQLATLERSLKKRPTGRIYLDHLQNARGKSVVAPYSVRAQPGAPVSTPLEWQEVQRPLQPRDFTIRNVPQRLARQGDPFAPVLTHGQRLDDALRHLEKLLRTPLSRQTQRRNKQAASTG